MNSFFPLQQQKRPPFTIQRVRSQASSSASSIMSTPTAATTASTSSMTSASYLGLAPDNGDMSEDTVLNRTKIELGKHLLQIKLHYLNHRCLPTNFQPDKVEPAPLVPRRLHISNLPYYFGEDDLRRLASEYGRVVHVSISLNERGSKGYGFVSFENEEQCHFAAENLRTKIIGDRQLVVNGASLKPFRWKNVWRKFVINIRTVFEHAVVRVDPVTGHPQLLQPTSETLTYVINQSANVPQHHLRQEHTAAPDLPLSSPHLRQQQQQVQQQRMSSSSSSPTTMMMPFICSNSAAGASERNNKNSNNSMIVRGDPAVAEAAALSSSMLLLHNNNNKNNNDKFKYEDYNRHQILHQQQQQQQLLQNQQHQQLQQQQSLFGNMQQNGSSSSTMPLNSPMLFSNGGNGGGIYAGNGAGSGGGAYTSGNGVKTGSYGGGGGGGSSVSNSGFLPTFMRSPSQQQQQQYGNNYTDYDFGYACNNDSADIFPSFGKQQQQQQQQEQICQPIYDMTLNNSNNGYKYNDVFKYDEKSTMQLQQHQQQQQQQPPSVFNFNNNDVSKQRLESSSFSSSSASSFNFDLFTGPAVTAADDGASNTSASLLLDASCFETVRELLESPLKK